MNKITIVGAGSFGTALAQILSNNNNKVILYTRQVEIVNQINNDNQNKQYFENIKLNKNITATNDLNKAINSSEIILIAVPSKYVRDVIKNIKQIIKKPKLFITATKGIENITHQYTQEIIFEEIGAKYIENVVVITGPNHAEEIIQNLATVVVVGSNNLKAIQKVQKLLENDSVKTQKSFDTHGLEFVGAIKNPYAILIGIANGLGYKQNFIAYLMTKSLQEMANIGDNLGYNQKTIYGVAGLGDFLVTANNKHSRNYRFGKILAQSNFDIDVAKNTINQTIEGLNAIKSIYSLCEANQINAPLIEMLYKIITTKSYITKEQVFKI